MKKFLVKWLPCGSPLILCLLLWGMVQAHYIGFNDRFTPEEPTEIHQPTSLDADHS